MSAEPSDKPRGWTGGRGPGRMSEGELRRINSPLWYLHLGAQRVMGGDEVDSTGVSVTTDYR